TDVVPPSETITPKTSELAAWIRWGSLKVSTPAVGKVPPDRTHGLVVSKRKAERDATLAHAAIGPRPDAWATAARTSQATRSAAGTSRGHHRPAGGHTVSANAHPAAITTPRQRGAPTPLAMSPKSARPAESRSSAA